VIDMYRTRYVSVVAVLAALTFFVSACAFGPVAPSGPDYERTRRERVAEHERDDRDRQERRTEHRDERDWARWISAQERDEGPIVLDRADIVLKAAIARAEYGTDGATRLTHLRMTEAARRMLAQDVTERALDLLERAIAVDGREGFAYLYLGYVYVRRGESGRAKEFLDQAARLLPPDEALRYELDNLRELAATPVNMPQPVRGRM
jgi:tetratricopeptide (TPR) repeat protein